MMTSVCHVMDHVEQCLLVTQACRNNKEVTRASQQTQDGNHVRMILLTSS